MSQGIDYAERFRQMMDARFPAYIEANDDPSRRRARITVGEIWQASQFVNRNQLPNCWKYYPERAADNLDCWRKVTIISVKWAENDCCLQAFDIQLVGQMPAIMQANDYLYVEENDLFSIRS